LGLAGFSVTSFGSGIVEPVLAGALSSLGVAISACSCACVGLCDSLVAGTCC